MQPQAVAGNPFRQIADEFLQLFLPGKNLFSLVAPGSDMLKTSRQVQPQWAGH
jgi:hypothetical protein